MESEPPLLVLVHGTGAQDHDTDKLYDPDNLYGSRVGPYNSRVCPRLQDHGSRWWQCEGQFVNRLAARIMTRDGHRLEQDGMIFRLKWSGSNSERGRDEGAFHFAKVFEAAAPRRVHIVAHSHGGNVVRTGIENLNRWGFDISRIGVVISMGTPFFVHSSRKVRRVMAMTLLAALLFAIAIISYSVFWSLGKVAFTLFQGWVSFSTAAFTSALFVFLALRTLAMIRRPSRGVGLKGSHEVKWINFISRNDEALQLLKSFDNKIPLFTSAKRSQNDNMVVVATYLLVFSILFLSAYWVLDHLRVRPVAKLFAASFISLILVGNEFASIKFVYSKLISGSSRILDAMLTARLRRLAYGDHDGAGITGVSTDPWSDHPSAQCVLPEEVEDKIEERIASSTAGLWAKARHAITPNASFLDANFSYLIEGVLTGDELAHTVYYNVDGFIDMVADALIATGDYVAVVPSAEADLRVQTDHHLSAKR